MTSAVAGVDPTVNSDLSPVDAATAQLDPSQVSSVAAVPDVVVTPNVPVKVQDTVGDPGRAPAAVFPEQTGASQLWAQGDTGQGVNVAVLDTGISPLPDFAGRLVDGVDLSGGHNPWNDQYGHGTFVAGLIAGDGASSNGQYMGEAPGAGLVSVKVAGATGKTNLVSVIEGVGWTIAHAAKDNIGVLNMSLGYLPLTSTVLDPLDQAVEKAWEAGITVVVSAGNSGPGNGTILAPGDDPLVITAGAVDDGGQVDLGQRHHDDLQQRRPDQPRRLVQARPGDVGPFGREPARPGFHHRRAEPVRPRRHVRTSSARAPPSARPSRPAPPPCCSRPTPAYDARHREGHAARHDRPGPGGQPVRGRARRPRRGQRGRVPGHDLVPVAADPGHRHGRRRLARRERGGLIVEPGQLDRVGLERFGLERVRLERIGLERIRLERIGLERFGLERVDLERVGLERFGLERVGLERVGLERVGLERVGLERIGLERIGLD